MYPFCVNGKTSMYWNWEDNCPQVFIDGVCKNEGNPNAKAGWGFKYGPEKSNSRGGEVSGAQTAQRARITAAIDALRWAVYLPTVDKISIISKDNLLSQEVYGERAAGNEDLWGEVDKLRKNVEASFEIMQIYEDEEEEDNYFTIPLAHANKSAGISKNAENSNNNVENEKIHVSCRPLDETNTKAEYTVFFGDEDPRNKSGVILGEFAIQRADLTGLQKVLEQAVQSGIRRPHITTDAKYLYMVDRFRQRWKSLGWTSIYGAELPNRKMIILIDTLCEKFEKVRIELVPGPRYTPKA